MNGSGNVHQFSASRGVTISFAERYAASEQFQAVFKEGMALVERTAAYLDGEGRKDARRLKAPITVAYASESMRLTTRLLELASWLLLRRSINAGELGSEEAQERRRKVKLKAIGRPTHVKGYEELPETLRELIDRSFALQDRILVMDRLIETAGLPPRETAESPLAPQLARLQAAFPQTKLTAAGG